MDLNATPYLYYDFDGIAAGNHTGVNAILWYNGGNSYLQFSQLVNGDVNDLMSNQSGRVDVRSYLRDKGAFPSDGKLEISYVTISVATWKAGKQRGIPYLPLRRSVTALVSLAAVFSFAECPFPNGAGNPSRFSLKRGAAVLGRQLLSSSPRWQGFQPSPCSR